MEDEPGKRFVPCGGLCRPIVSALVQVGHAERVLQLIVDTVAEHFRSQACAIVIRERIDDVYRIRNNRGLSHLFVKAYRRHGTTGVVKELMLTGKPVVIDDSSQSPDNSDVIRLEHPFVSAGCFRIMTNHHPMGYLHVEFSHRTTLSPQEVTVLQTLADFAAIAVLKEDLVEANARLDPTDAETGLPKFSVFLRSLEEHVRMGEVFKQPLAIMIVDINSFRSVVNEYGHQAAREVLAHLGQFIRSRLRTVDVVSRWGLNEFMILMPNVSHREARGYAEQLRKAVEHHRFTEKQLHCTISIGLVFYPSHGSNADRLLSSATIALFEAKQRGKNVVVTLGGLRELIDTKEYAAGHFEPQE